MSSARIHQEKIIQYYCRRCSSLKNSQWNKDNCEKSNKYQLGKRAYDLLKICDRDHTTLSQVTKKNSRTGEFLGISLEEFKNYIENLMSREMSWKNKDLNHVRPLSSFNLTDPDQLKEAVHFSNIQPLLRIDNRKKDPKYHERDLVVQNEKLYSYGYFRFPK